MLCCGAQKNERQLLFDEKNAVCSFTHRVATKKMIKEAKDSYK
jgi:hypothetical protein